MKNDLKKVHEHYRKHYFNEEIADRLKKNVHQKINNLDTTDQKKQRNFVKKISYAAAACMILFGLFIVSAFVSPAMAEVASKIPFLSKIFEQEPIHDVLMDELKEQGYEISGAGYTVKGKTYHVTVAGTEEYYNQVKEDIKKVAEDVISSRGYDSFKVEVEMERLVDYDELENDPRYQKSELLAEALNKIVPKLQQQGYKIHNYVLMYPSPDTDEFRLDLDIEDTEKRMDEIEKAIYEGIKNQNIEEDFTIEFYPFNVQDREIENRWSIEVIPVISEGMLSKKEYKTKGVGYSFKSGTMNIFITTTIQKSDKEAPELANKIDMAIQEFLQSDDLKGIVGDTPYKVVVRDKDSQDMN